MISEIVHSSPLHILIYLFESSMYSKNGVKKKKKNLLFILAIFDKTTVIKISSCLPGFSLDLVILMQ